MTGIEPGAEVRLFTPARHDREQPLTGRPGKVLRTGKQYATARFDDGSEVMFDMTTGFVRASFTGQRVKTPAQVDYDWRLKEAIATLREAGLDVRMGRTLSLGLAEALVATIETWGQEGEG